MEVLEALRKKLTPLQDETGLKVLWHILINPLLHRHSQIILGDFQQHQYVGCNVDRRVGTNEHTNRSSSGWSHVEQHISPLSDERGLVISK